MPFRRRRFRRSGSNPKGRKVWGGWDSFAVSGGISPITLSPDSYTHTWVMSPQDAMDFYDEPTVIRMLFRFHAAVELAVISDLSNNFAARVFASIQVIKDLNAATPAFINQRDNTGDYLWWDGVMFHHLNNHAIGFTQLVSNSGPYSGVIDVRTKRKIPEGYGLSFQVWNAGNSQIDAAYAECPITYHTSGRYLMVDH